MANTASAIKRVRSNERKRDQNRLTRARTRTALRKANDSLGETDKAAARAATLAAASALDKAANKGTLHKNNAARRKSRLMKKLAAMGGSES